MKVIRLSGIKIKLLTLTAIMIWAFWACGLDSSATRQTQELELQQADSPKILNELVGQSFTDSSFQSVIDQYGKWRRDRDRYQHVIKELKLRLKVYENTISALEELMITESKFHSESLKKHGSSDSLLLSALDDMRSILTKLQRKKEGLNKMLKGTESDYLTEQKRGVKIQQSALEIGRKLSGEGNFVFDSIPYSYYIADLSKEEIRFHLKDPKRNKNYGSINNLLRSDALSGRSINMITNGGMFKPNHQPQGLYIENGSVLTHLDTLRPNNNLNFYLKPNGVFFLDTFNKPGVTTTQEFKKGGEMLSKGLRFATQSGPMLVVEGEIHPKLTYRSRNKHIRSGVGVMSNGKIVFIISRKRANFFDVASVFKEFFGCANALYLDGAISLMYLQNTATDELGGDFGPMISVSHKVDDK